MGLRLKSEIISNLLNKQITNTPLLETTIPIKSNKKKDEVTLEDIIENKPSIKIVRQYIKNEINIINDNADEDFMNKIS